MKIAGYHIDRQIGQGDMAQSIMPSKSLSNGQVRIITLRRDWSLIRAIPSVDAPNKVC
jgi:hypothetical protein